LPWGAAPSESTTYAYLPIARSLKGQLSEQLAIKYLQALAELAALKV